MLNKSTNYINLISIFILVFMAFVPLKPNNVKVKDFIEENFSIENAYEHVSALSKFPRYVGSNNHFKVKAYLIKQLQLLGLDVKTQRTNVVNKQNTFVKVNNILARIKGSDSQAKSLVIMSHYDSAAYSSPGAADAGSGVAVILEGVRAYLKQEITPKNDIIILLTDAEEIGLLGAKAFVNKHVWANNVGAVLNFEARGTAGNSYMIIETNQGNRQLLDAYNSAGLSFQHSNSLAYSVSKSLPNDTDLSIFNRDKNIVGYNFAFIDNHFNYHTVNDNLENLSLDSLAYQAHYLMPMMKKLSQMDLTTLESNADDVYFQIPFYKTISYPFDWTLSITLINLLLFIIIIGAGVKNNSLRLKSVLTGSFPLLKALTMTALISFSILKFLYWLHPHYSEMLQGFTYNGYLYILFFSLLAASICYFFYRKTVETHNASELMIAPVFIWILISLISALSIKGAHFFSLISIVGTLALFINVILKKPQPSLTLLLFAPIILIFSPFFMQLPVALGLIVLPFSGLILVLLLSVFISSIHIPKQFSINKWIFIVILSSTYIYAETQSSFNQNRPLPNSLYYFQDKESNQAYWFSHDYKTDNWSKGFFTDKIFGAAKALAEFQDKHWHWAKIVSNTDNRNIKYATIEVLKDRKYSDKRIYQLKITPGNGVNRLNVITNNDIHLHKLAINGEALNINKDTTVAKTQLARIYRSNETAFIIDIEIDTNESLDLTLIEINPNLLTSNYFNIPARTKEFIPKPFVFSDSIITKQQIIL